MIFCTGGQTGVDRAVLDFSLENDFEYCGYCPARGWAEDMETSPGLLLKYPKLVPTIESDPFFRTFKNVHISNAVLGLFPEVYSKGTKQTILSAENRNKKFLYSSDLLEISRWIENLGLDHQFVLNIAGPRASEFPEGYSLTKQLLENLLGILK